MSHSGCYGPLPGLGHHIPTNAARPSKNSTKAAKSHMKTARIFHYLGVPQILDPTRLSAQDESHAPLLTSLRMVTGVSFLL